MDLPDLIIFFIGWLVCSLIWAIWLDGIFVPAAGLISILAAIGAFKVVFNINH